MSDPFLLLLRLKLEGTVREYREKFEGLAREMELADRRYLRNMFLNGLKEEVSVELNLHSFESLKEMMTMAEKVDERNRVYIGGGSTVLFGSQGRVRDGKGLRTSTWGPSGRGFSGNG